MTVVTIVFLAMIGAWADESAAQELKSDAQGTTIVVNWQTRKGGKTSFASFAKDKMMQLPATYDGGRKSKGRECYRC